MPLTNPHGSLSFSLSAKDRAESTGQNSFSSALSSALVSALGVALQRCSYPPLKCLDFITPFYPPLPMGTFLLWQLGDISILG